MSAGAAVAIVFGYIALMATFDGIAERSGSKLAGRIALAMLVVPVTAGGVALVAVLGWTLLTENF